MFGSCLQLNVKSNLLGLNWVKDRGFMQYLTVTNLSFFKS